MDQTGASQNQKTEQLARTAEAAHAAQIEGRLKDLHTCLPGIIASFDPDSQTASVQPAIKRIFIEKGPVNLPLCVDVPVQFPSGGGYTLTFPVAQGDECLLHFSERCIDFWHANGGVQLPGEYRLHDLSDAFAIVGVRSRARLLSPPPSSTAAQLRTDDGQTYLEIGPGGKVRVQAVDIELHASHSYSWDVDGYGQRITSLGGGSYENHTWQEGASMTTVVDPIAPPEGP